MDLVVAYQKVTDRVKAFELVCERITPEYIKGFKVSANVKYDKENTKLVAAGKNFELTISFTEEEAEVSLELPFVFRPLKGSILAKIGKELVEVL